MPWKAVVARADEWYTMFCNEPPLELEFKLLEDSVEGRGYFEFDSMKANLRERKERTLFVAHPNDEGDDVSRGQTTSLCCCCHVVSLLVQLGIRASARLSIGFPILLGGDLREFYRRSHPATVNDKYSSSSI